MLFPVAPLLRKYVVFAVGFAILNVVFNPAQLVLPAMLGAFGKGIIVVATSGIVPEMLPEFAVEVSVPRMIALPKFPEASESCKV